MAKRLTDEMLEAIQQVLKVDKDYKMSGVSVQKLLDEIQCLRAEREFQPMETIPKGKQVLLDGLYTDSVVIGGLYPTGAKKKLVLREFDTGPLFNRPATGWMHLPKSKENVKCRKP